MVAAGLGSHRQLSSADAGFHLRDVGCSQNDRDVIAGKLQQAGFIRYHRGRIQIVDRLKLEEAACECYRTIRRRTEAVFHTPQTALIRSAASLGNLF